MGKSLLNKIIILAGALLLVSCSNFSSATYDAPPASYNTAMWDGNTAGIWDKLQHTSSARLAKMQIEEKNPSHQAWLELALISKRNSTNTQQLARELLAWQERNQDHEGSKLLPSAKTLEQLISSPPPKQIAILLPQQGTYGSSGKIVREGFLNAYYANLSKVGKQNIKFYDTSQTKDMAALYQQAIDEGADFVIGPLVKDNVQNLSKSGSFRAPTLALNYSNNSRWLGPPSNFYEFGLLPEDEVIQIADKARRAGASKALVIAPQNAWGKRLVTAFTARWQASGGSIQDTLLYSAKANFNAEVAHLLNVDPVIDKQLMKESNDKEILEEQRRQDFDVIFLFTQPQQARAIIPLLRYYYANNVPIYATSSIYSGKLNPATDVDLNGVIVCDVPWNLQNARQTVSNDTQSDRLYAVGQDAYLLSQTLDRLIQMPNFPIYGTTGALTMLNNHQIHRRIPCVMVQNGRI